MVSVCEVDPNKLDNYSWYELGLFSERAKIKRREEWNLARHIMWAAGNWKPGTTPQQVLRLEGDNLRNAPASKQEALEIVDRLYKYLPKKSS